MVRVFNDRGEILVGSLSLIIPEHVIAICEGVWRDPEVLNKRAFASMAASMS